MALKASRYLKIKPEMINEVATGLEEGKDIAQRYGFSEAEWDEIKERPDFQQAVAKVRSEMERSGQTFRLKAAVMADSLMENMYKHAMDSETPVKDKATALQLLTRVGELEPKASAQVSAGPGFSITINLPVAPPKEEDHKEEDHKEEAIEAEEAQVVEPMSLTFGAKDEGTQVSEDAGVEAGHAAV